VLIEEKNRKKLAYLSSYFPCQQRKIKKNNGFYGYEDVILDCKLLVVTSGNRKRSLKTAPFASKNFDVRGNYARNFFKIVHVKGCNNLS